jgi:hypothetical protein
MVGRIQHDQVDWHICLGAERVMATILKLGPGGLDPLRPGTATRTRHYSYPIRLAAMPATILIFSGRTRAISLEINALASLGLS